MVRRRFDGGAALGALGVLALLLAGCQPAKDAGCSASATEGCEVEAPADAASPEREDSDVPQLSPLDSHAVLTGYVSNARDLGGLPTQSGGTVAYDALFRGAPLSSLSDEGCEAVRALGLRTVIDLRIDTERAARPNAPCVLEQVNEVLAPLPVPYEVSPRDYVADLDTTESIAAVFAALGDEAAYPVYFHCTWGRDRTGVLAAVILSALGVPRERVLQEYMLSQPSVGAYPASLNAVLDTLEQRGGIDAYLDAAGIPAEQREVLRARATQ